MAGDCPNIVKLHTVYECTENVYILIDYKEGGDLKDFRLLSRGLGEQDI